MHVVFNILKKLWLNYETSYGFTRIWKNKVTNICTLETEDKTRNQEVRKGYSILPPIFEIFSNDIVKKKEPRGKGKYQSMDNTKIGKERGNSYGKNEEIFRWKAHINTQKEREQHLPGYCQ